MKKRRNFKSDSGVHGVEQVLSADACPTVPTTGSVCAFTGLTQEDYVNPRYLGAGMVDSISNINFGALWL